MHHISTETCSIAPHLVQICTRLGPQIAGKASSGAEMHHIRRNPFNRSASGANIHQIGAPNCR